MYLPSENKRILNSALNGILTNCELDLCLYLSVYYDFNQGQLLDSNKVFIILNGSAVAFNHKNEIVKSYSDGLVGLNNLYTNQKWQEYYIKSDTSLSVLSINASKLLSIIKNHSGLLDYLHKKTVDLDLLLLHLNVTANSWTRRINLLPYLSSLREFVFTPGLVPGTMFLSNNAFLILYCGSLIHDSGLELSPGLVYACSQLPQQGEWMIMDDAYLFCYQSDNLDSSNNFDNHYVETNNLTLETFFTGNDLVALIPREQVSTANKSQKLSILSMFLFIFRQLWKKLR